MVGVQHEEDIEDLGETGVRDVVSLREAIHHVEEVLCVSQVVDLAKAALEASAHRRESPQRRTREHTGDMHRLVVGLANAMAVGVGRDRDGLAENPIDLLVADLGATTGALVDIGADLDQGGVLVRVEGAQRRDGGHHHTHRVGVVPEGRHELIHVVVEVSVRHDAVGEGRELIRGRERPVQKQERGLPRNRHRNEVPVPRKACCGAPGLGWLVVDSIVLCDCCDDRTFAHCDFSEAANLHVS